MASSVARAMSEHPFLAGLSTAHVARLSTCARQVELDAGSYVLREGAEADTLYLLLEGRVALEVHVPSRGPLQVETLGGGDILGLHWVFPPRRWVLDARVVSPLRAIALDASCVMSLLEEDPALGYAVTKRLLEQVYARLQRTRLQRLDVYRAEP